MARNYLNKAADEWYENLKADLSTFPFSFVYDSISYRGFGSDFIKTGEEIKTENGKETVNVQFELKGELTVNLKLVHYYSHGVTEWTVEFENKTNKDTKVITDVKTVLKLKGANPILKGSLGDHENKYKVYTRDLSKENVSFVSDSGRATHVNFPYFNLEYGDGGAMLAIGWAGTWTADFTADGEDITYIAGAVNNLATYLKPAEKIRTALFVYAPYTVRDEHYATNFWRSWFMEHNLPKADETGAAMEPFSTCNLAFDTGRTNSDGSISETCDTWRPSLEKMIEEDVKVDFRWFDAGWYIAPDLKSAESYSDDHDWWYTVGTWEFDPAKWPGKTFLESTEFARDHGMKTLMWFEPERVTYHEDLVKNFGYKPEWAIVTYDSVRKRVSISNNIGDPECYKWTVDRICKVLRENKVEMYREDNNTNPGEAWRILDESEGENRSGITECKFIDAHYRMWDDIIECTKSYGGCGFVDSCASGGGRNDLESMRRGVPLLRSDADRTSTCLRLSMTTSFNKWIPFNGASTKEETFGLNLKGKADQYTWRCSYLPILNVETRFVQEPKPDFDMLRYGLKTWKKVAPYLIKEFYVLTPWHDEKDKTGFTAFAYYDDETKKGVLFVFRREECLADTIGFELPFMKDGTSCKFVDADDETVISCTEANLTLTLDRPRTAKQYFFEVI